MESVFVPIISFSLASWFFTTYSLPIYFYNLLPSLKLFKEMDNRWSTVMWIFKSGVLILLDYHALWILSFMVWCEINDIVANFENSVWRHWKGVLVQHVSGWFFNDVWITGSCNRCYQVLDLNEKQVKIWFVSAAFCFIVLGLEPLSSLLYVCYFSVLYFIHALLTEYYICVASIWPFKWLAELWLFGRMIIWVLKARSHAILLCWFHLIDLCIYWHFRFMIVRYSI